MSGSMRQRGAGSWELRVYLRYDPHTARRRYHTKTFRGSEREARRELALLVADAHDPESPTGLTVDDAFEQWFESARGGWSPSTVATTRVVLDAHVFPHIGSLALGRLSPDVIDDLYATLLERGGRGGKPLSATTVQRTHDVLHRAMAFAVRRGWAPLNPVSLAARPRRAFRRLCPPTPEMVLRLIAQAETEGPIFGALVRFAASTGARRGEICALRWSDVDLDAGTVSIARSVVHARDAIVEKDTKTHNIRCIALDDGTTAALRHLRSEVERDPTVEQSDDRYVFGTGDGRAPRRPDSVTQAFARIAARAGMGGVRFHDMRHFVATRLLANGIDVRTVAGRLGHSNPFTTLTVYAAFVPEADRNAAELLGRLLGG